MTLQYRAIALTRQSLLSQQSYGSGLAGTLEATKHLAYVPASKRVFINDNAWIINE